MENVFAYSNSTHEKTFKTQFLGDLSNVEKITTFSHRCDMTTITTQCKTTTIKTKSSKITNAKFGQNIIVTTYSTTTSSFASNMNQTYKVSLCVSALALFWCSMIHNCCVIWLLQHLSVCLWSSSTSKKILQKSTKITMQNFIHLFFPL